MLVRKFWLPKISSNDVAPNEYTVESGGDVLEPAGDVYADKEDGDARDLLELRAHRRAEEFVLCASLCNVAT